MDLFWKSIEAAGIEVGPDDEVLQIPDEYMQEGLSEDTLLNHIVDYYDDETITMRSGNSYPYTPGRSIDNIPVYASENGGVEIHRVLHADESLEDSEYGYASPEVQIKEIEKHPLSSESPSTRQGKGWHELAPRKGKERNELKAKCGDACFLRPDDNGFPICAALTRTNTPCAVDCRGLAAAKSRSRTLAPEVKAEIPVLQEHYGCKGKKK